MGSGRQMRTATGEAVKAAKANKAPGLIVGEQLAYQEFARQLLGLKSKVRQHCNADASLIRATPRDKRSCHATSDARNWTRAGALAA